MQILALTFGGSDCASTHYRIVQYIEPLRDRHGITVDAIPAAGFNQWPGISGYDAVIIQKKLLSLDKLHRVRRRARRLIYDLDDAIWHPHGKLHSCLTQLRTRMRLRNVARMAGLCLVANSVLGEHLARWSSNLRVFRMALDERVWTAKAPGLAGGAPLRIGWTGAPANLPYLEALEPVLLRIVEEYAGAARIVVACGKRPSFEKLDAYDFVEYQSGREAETVRAFDIGLLPLPGDAFSNGKSPIKALQYMASGLPAVASDSAGTREMYSAGGAILATDTDGFYRGIKTLVEEPAERRRLGKEARARFALCHTLTGQAAELASILERFWQA